MTEEGDGPALRAGKAVLLLTLTLGAVVGSVTTGTTVGTLVYAVEGNGLLGLLAALAVTTGAVHGSTEQLRRLGRWMGVTS